MKKILLLAVLVLGGFSATSFAKERPYNLLIDVFTVVQGSTSTYNVDVRFACYVVHAGHGHLSDWQYSDPVGNGQIRMNIQPIVNQFATITCDGAYMYNGNPVFVNGQGGLTLNPNTLNRAIVHLQ